MTREGGDWYATPLYYDVVFQDLNRAETRFLDELCAEATEEAGDERPCRLLEPACGSGRLMLGLAMRGHDVAGFDLTPEMVAFSKERLRKDGFDLEVCLGDMATFRPADAFSDRRPFDVVHCLVNTFKYLMTDRDALFHLRAMAKSVRKGGYYVLGLHVSEYHDRRSSEEEWHGTEGQLEVFCTIKSDAPDPRRRTEAMHSTLRAIRRGHPDELIETHWNFRTYSATELRGLIARAPDWRLVSVHDFDYDWQKTVPMQGDRLDRIVLLQRR